jgi:GNAT superfamily N-acetyltransferase
MTLQINTSANEEQLLEIKHWLIDEHNKLQEGFYCNWSVIEKHFERGQLIVLNKDSRVIGFSTWEIEKEIVLNIAIVEIHPDYRGKGYGEYLMQQVFNFGKDHKKAIVAKLFCAPVESKSFWKKMGFMDFPFTGYAQPPDLMYLPLIDLRSQLKADHSEESTIELWNCEPHLSDECEPQWVWSAKINNGQLIPPILAPCNRNWNIRYTQNGTIIKESKIKYFSNSNPIDKDSFLLIQELNLL